MLHPSFIKSLDVLEKFLKNSVAYIRTNYIEYLTIPDNMVVKNILKFFESKYQEVFKFYYDKVDLSGINSLEVEGQILMTMAYSVIWIYCSVFVTTNVSLKSKFIQFMK